MVRLKEYLMASMTEVMMVDQNVILKERRLASMMDENLVDLKGHPKECLKALNLVALKVQMMGKNLELKMAQLNAILKELNLVRLKGYPKEYLMVSERDLKKGSLTVMMMEVNLGYCLVNATANYLVI
jgi:hypothetical protein